MKRMIAYIGVALLLLFGQSSFAGSGLLFNVAATGTPGSVSIILCLNGKGPFSCQNYNVSALSLSISTTAPNHSYPGVGIIINTPGYTIANLGIDCTQISNGYCLFSASNTTPKTIMIKSTNPPATYSIGGSVSGLTASGLVLQNNSGDTLPVNSGATSFQFTTPVAYGGSYNVTVATQPTGLTCTVGNGSGTNVMSNVTNISITCSASTYTIGGTITGLTASGLVLQNNGANNLSVSSGATTFQFSTPVAYGGNYNVAVSSQPPGLTCTVSNGAGTISTSNITNVSVFCAKEFAYVANYALNLGTVSLCSTTQSTGELTCPGTTGSGFSGATALAINQSSTFAYIANYDGNTVSLCSITQSTGALTCSGTTGNGFNGPSAIVINPPGTIAYVSNANNNTVSKCDITPNTGELINCAITGSGFNFPEYIAINPQNTFAYVVDSSTLAVTLCSITQNTGDLINCADTNGAINASFGVAINPAGTFVYTSDYYGNLVYVCSITQNTGELTNCAATGGIFNGPGGITVNSAGTFAYVSNYNGGTVSLCSIEPSTGALTCPGTTGNGFSNPSAVAY